MMPDCHSRSSGGGSWRRPSTRRDNPTSAASCARALPSTGLAYRHGVPSWPRHGQAGVQLAAAFDPDHPSGLGRSRSDGRVLRGPGRRLRLRNVDLHTPLRRCRRHLHRASRSPPRRLDRRGHAVRGILEPHPDIPDLIRLRRRKRLARRTTRPLGLRLFSGFSRTGAGGATVWRLQRPVAGGPAAAQALI